MQVVEDRPQEYYDALEQLKHSFHKSIEIVQKLREIGAKFGLSNDMVRKDIETALQGALTTRQIRNLLPIELKDMKKARFAEVTSAKTPKTFTFRSKIMKYSRDRHVIVITSKMNQDIKPFLGREVTICVSD